MNSATAFTRLCSRGENSTIPARVKTKRFGIFRKLEEGAREFVSVNDDESSAKTEAIFLKEQTGSDHVVFNLKTRIKAFDTELYDRHLKKWTAMNARQPGEKPGRSNRRN